MKNILSIKESKDIIRKGKVVLNSYPKDGNLGDAFRIVNYNDELYLINEHWEQGKYDVSASITNIYKLDGMILFEE